MYCWQSVFQRTAWQVDNLFPLDPPSYLYSIHHAPLSQEGGGCLHLPHLSGTPPPPPIFTRFNHRKKVRVRNFMTLGLSLTYSQTIREGKAWEPRATVGHFPSPISLYFSCLTLSDIVLIKDIRLAIPTSLVTTYTPEEYPWKIFSNAKGIIIYADWHTLSLPLHSAMWSLEPLTAEEEDEEKKGFKIHGFNQFLSDRLPLDREVPDTRDPRWENPLIITDIRGAAPLFCWYSRVCVVALYNTNVSPAVLIASIPQTSRLPLWSSSSIMRRTLSSYAPSPVSSTGLPQNSCTRSCWLMTIVTMVREGGGKGGGGRGGGGGRKEGRKGGRKGGREGHTVTLQPLLLVHEMPHPLFNHCRRLTQEAWRLDCSQP